MYGSEWKVRRRSVGNFINELKEITRCFPFIESIRIEDDVFLDSTKTIIEFSEAYKREIKLPLIIGGVQPSMVSEEKISPLIDAGMVQIRMGIQTGSVETLHKVYNRPGSKNQILRATKILNKYAHKFRTPPLYDFIVDNPWEPEEEQLKTLTLLLEIPKPFVLNLFSLTLFPGTDLYHRASQDGLLHNDHREVYLKDNLISKRSYKNGLFELFKIQIAPHWIIKLLLNKKLQRLNWVWLPHLLYQFFYFITLIQAGWRSILRGNWGAFSRALDARVTHLRSRHWVRQFRSTR